MRRRADPATVDVGAVGISRVVIYSSPIGSSAALIPKRQPKVAAFASSVRAIVCYLIKNCSNDHHCGEDRLPVHGATSPGGRSPGGILSGFLSNRRSVPRWPSSPPHARLMCLFDRCLPPHNRGRLSHLHQHLYRRTDGTNIGHPVLGKYWTRDAGPAVNQPRSPGRQTCLRQPIRSA